MREQAERRSSQGETMSSVKDSIYSIVEGLSEEEAEDLLDYLNMRADPDSLTEEELARVASGRAEIANGEYVTLEEIQRRRTAG